VTDIVMPRLSDTMEEGTILRWLKRDGERVQRGEELVEIETDKANMTYESDSEGILETVAHEGDTLAVGELIAHIGEGVARREAVEASPVLAPARTVEPESASQLSPQAPPAAPVEAANGKPHEQAGRVKASPLARRMARESGVDLSSLTGSGPGGRIVKADVEASSSARIASVPSPIQSTPAPAETPVSAPAVGDLASAKGETSIVELSRTQRTIARRMAESRATIPDFTLRLDVDMQRCMELRAELKRLAQAPSGDGARVPTYNDMVVKACALALREHPRANGSYRDGRFELHARVNVGVAVAVDADDALHSALVVPTIFDAGSKSLGEIARETHALAERVRDGSITPPELSGATFTVSNLGMYGVESFTAIVNPPQAAILAVGSVQPRVVAPSGSGGREDERQPVVRHTMTFTLSCDHRILYGADAALFLARIRELLQEPAALTL
jgi:pyruvate dehydrogenase E2 component (dihydrolipoyllysine-residue acetyltransferase)